MIQKIDARIESVCPMLFHNVQMVDHQNPFAIALKEITSKRKKTNADHDAIVELEWRAGLYTNADGRIIVPGKNIEACLKGAAKANRLGKKFDAGVFVPDDPELEYDGAKDVDKLFADRRFIDRQAVVISRAKIIRTRPIFHKWAIAFSILFNDEIVNVNDVNTALKLAGSTVGIGDYRPRYGRFSVKEFS